MKMKREQAWMVVKKAKDELLRRRIVAIDGSGDKNIESLLILAGEAALGRLEIIDATEAYHPNR